MRLVLIRQTRTALVPLHTAADILLRGVDDGGSGTARAPGQTLPELPQQPVLGNLPQSACGQLSNNRHWSCLWRNAGGMAQSVSFRACLTDGGALDDEVPAAADGVGLQEPADPQVAPQRHRRALVTARHRAHEEHTETWGERADEGTQWTEDTVYGSQSTRSDVTKLSGTSK